MKIVVFNGGPRKGGNMETLINEVSKPIQEAGIETELVQLGRKLLYGYAPCYTCFETKDGQRVIKTGPMSELIRKAQEADGTILASPTYHDSASMEMKAFMDRLGLTIIGQGCTLTRKVGAAAISVRRGGAITVYDGLNRFMLGSGMTVPESTYWNFGVGGIPGEVYDDTEGLRNMKDLGVQLARLLKATYNR